jgi:hypothetical protein
MRKHLKCFANTYGHSRIHPYRYTHGCAYAYGNGNSCSHSDSNAYIHSYCHANRDRNANANRNRMCIRSGLLEKSSCPVASNPVATWQRHI